MDDFTSSDWQRLQRIEKALDHQKGLLIGIERMSRQQKGKPARRCDPGMTLVKMACAYATDQGSDAIETIRRSAVMPADTVTPGWAAELSQSVVAGFILSIAGQSAYAALATRSEPLNFGRAGQQAITYGGSATAGFVSEGDMIGVTAAAIAKMTVKPAKICAIASFSSEVAKSSNFENIMRKLLRDAVSQSVDSVFFSDDAGSASAPAGVLNGLTAVAPSAASDPARAMVEDMGNLVAALDGPADPCFVLAPSKLVAVSTYSPALPYPVFASSAVPADRLVCVDAAALAAAHDAVPEFLNSVEAAIQEQDPSTVTSPLMSGTPVRSFWQTNTRGLLVTLGCSWKTRPGGASYTEPVTW